MRKPFQMLLFSAGWVLSPFTFWNDLFVNIPLSYLLASLFAPILPVRFAWLVVACYALTNVAGIVLMYAGGSKMVADYRAHPRKAILIMVLLVTCLSFLMFMLDRAGIAVPLGDLLRRT